MNLGLNIALTDQMVEGIIVLNRQGQITDFNRAAQPWVHAVSTSAERLRRQIARMPAEAASNPVPADLPTWDDAALNGHPVYLCTTGDGGFALFIATVPSSDALDVPTLGPVDADFFRLLSAEMRHEFTAFRQRLASVKADQSIDSEKLLAQSDRLSRLLVAMDQLSRLHLQDAFTLGDRVAMTSLVDAALQDLPRMKCQFHTSHATTEALHAQSPIYGDSKWLQCMLTTLLTAVGEMAPQHSKVEIRVRQNGRYCVVSSHFLQGPGAPAAQAPRAADSARARFTIDTDIGMQIARRIVEMHGGQLACTGVDVDAPGAVFQGIESFTVILPTSAPAQFGESPSCRLCMVKLQTERYATDLAFLTPHVHKDGDVSEEELQMLAHISVPATSQALPPNQPKKVTP